MKTLSKQSFIIALASVCLSLPVAAKARQTTVNGRLSLGSNYDSNIYHTDKDRISEFNSSISPGLSLSSLGEDSKVDLSYDPEFIYNHRRGLLASRHGLSLDTEKALSSHWKLSMTDDYLYNDSPFFEADTSLSVDRQFQRADPFTQAEIVRLLFPEITWTPDLLTVVLSEMSRRYSEAPFSVRKTVDDLLAGGQGRQRYFTNNLSLASVYEFAADSQLTLGYRCNILDNRTGFISDKLANNPYIALTYRFNPQWRLEAGYDYQKANYDTSADSTTNHPRIQFDYNYSATDQIVAGFDYNDISHSDTSNDPNILIGNPGDSTMQTFSLGWNKALSQITSLNSSLDLSYDRRELGGDERQLALNLGLDRKYDRGIISLSGGGTWADSNYSSSWSNLRRSWRVRSDATYQVSEDLSSMGKVSYERRYEWYTGNKNTYNDLDLGLGLTYKFARWFALSLNYNYKLFETDYALLDNYNEHMIGLKLSVAKELWRL